MIAPTQRTAWVARCVRRLRELYFASVPLPGGDRGMIWPEYVRLVQQIMGEYREE
jgi:hypothetical protein